MSDVALTAALRSNLLSLQGTQKLLDSTQLRLATGLKVNSALDNPTAFFAAQSLNNRSSDLSRLLDGMGQSIQTLKAADEGIKALTTFLEQAQSLAQEAKDQATGGAVITGADLTAAEAADITTTAADAADQFTIMLGAAGSPIHTFTISAGETLQELANEINTIEGLKATVEPGTVPGTDTRIRLQSTNGQDITTADLGGNVAGATIFGAVGVTVATAGAPIDQTSLQASYDEVLTQIDDLVGDAGYRGTNLLDGGALTVTFNEDGTSTLTISGVDFSFGGLGIANADFSSIATIDTALDEIEGALTTVRAQSRVFGSNLNIIQTRQDFTESIVNTLREGADKLTLADKNEEGARLLSLQTTQQLGITSLALASQANQSVLRLFG
jgi:flagellin